MDNEFRPDNWDEILRDNLSINWVKENAKFYTLNYDDFSSDALIWKIKGTNGRGWMGIRMKREYEKEKGYYIELEPTSIDVEWFLDSLVKGDCITQDFNEALDLANLHTI